MKDEASETPEKIVCEKCGVEITTNKVRRERMGHVELAAPVSHIWYFRAIPSKMGLLLDISPKLLEKVLYFASYIVLDPGPVPSIEKKQILSETEYRKLYEAWEDSFTVGMGAEAIEVLLKEIDLEELSAQLKNELLTAQVEGAQLLGFGSGDPKPLLNYNEGRCKTWKGRAQLILRKNGTGPIRVCLSSDSGLRAVWEQA